MSYMTNPTWGLHIPGYSSPSPAQERLFKQRYPNVVAWHHMDVERREREQHAEEQRVRAKYAAKKGT